MKSVQHVITTFWFLFFVSGLTAQQVDENRVSVLFGAIQPLLLKGWNVEIDYYTDKLVFNYSHGWSLELRGSTVVGAAKDQHLSFHLPYSTGFGIGYRLTQELNVRFEAKWHKFQLYAEDEVFAKENIIGEYLTTTLGGGIYHLYRPFRKQENFLKGITLLSSVRYWHKIDSSLEEDQLVYWNRITGKEEIHEAANIGMANTPWILNVSVGYTF